MIVVMKLPDKPMINTSKIFRMCLFFIFSFFFVRYLISSNRSKFSSRWWKVLLWLGTILVLIGFFLLLIGFMLPRKKIDVETPLAEDSETMIVDRQALNYNANLDLSHFIGICLVVMGGILFTSSLLMPTFCYMWCAAGDSNDETDPLKVNFLFFC